MREQAARFVSHPRLHAFGLPGVVVALSTATAGAQGVSLTSSVQVANGRYFFPSTTTSIAWLNRFAIEGRRGGVALTLPFVTQDAGWVQWGGMGALATGGMPGHATSGSGTPSGGMMGSGSNMMRGNTMSGDWHLAIGDPIVAGEGTVWTSVAGDQSVRAIGQVKLPITSPDEGVSTGKVDVGAGALWTSQGERTSVQASVVAWRLGRVAGVPFRDPAWGTVSVARRLSDSKWTAVAFAYGSTSAIAGAPGAAILGGGATFASSASRRLFAALGYGLTNASPRLSISLGARWERLRASRCNRESC